MKQFNGKFVFYPNEQFEKGDTDTINQHNKSKSRTNVISKIENAMKEKEYVVVDTLWILIHK